MGRATGPGGADSATGCPSAAGGKAAMTSLDAWGPRSGLIGAYLHGPFCTQRCGSCSFNTPPDSPGAVARFLPALLGEMDLVARAPWAGAVGLRSGFLGGGAPSLAP